MRKVRLKLGSLLSISIGIDDVLIFVAFALFTWNGYVYALLESKHIIGSYQLMALIAGVLVLLIGEKTHKYSITVFFLIIVCLVSIFIKNETDYLLLDLSLVVAAYLLSFSGIKVFKAYAYASVITFIPFIIIYSQWYLSGRLSVFNRGALHLTTLVLLLISTLYISKVKPWIYYTLLLFAFIFDFICLSRTSSIAIVIAFVIVFMLDIQSERVESKYIKWGGLLLAFVILFLVFNSTIMGFIFKASSSVNFTAGRSFIWARLASNASTFGLNRADFKSLLGLEYNNAHNSYIQAGAVYGTIAFVIYIIWSLQALFSCIKNRKDLEIQGLIISIIPFVFISIFESNFIFDSVYPVMGFAVLLSYSRAINRSRELKLIKEGMLDENPL